MTTLTLQPLTAQAFAPFGDVLDCSGAPDKLINQGLCERFNDRARLDFGPEGRAGISMFRSDLRPLPLRVDMVERHPDGSQAFVPLSADPFLVIVAPDENGRPGKPLAFHTTPGQGVNYLRNIWHGILTPVAGTGLFAVVDRIGDTPNLEEFWFDAPYIANFNQ